jgi:hypothetical protein
LVKFSQEEKMFVALSEEELAAMVAECGVWIEVIGERGVA